MANKDTTDAARQEHYSYVLKQFAEQAAYIPITYEVNKAIYREGLEAFSSHPRSMRYLSGS